MNRNPDYETIEEITASGLSGVRKEFTSRCSLFYSSPATLQYNSPGAFGFGVKRTGLLLPESVMLLVGPECCGRNSSVFGSRTGYGDRMYYLELTETNLVTGNYLAKIPKAVCEICRTASPKPKAVLVCFTCVDALLATDAKQICERAQQACGVPTVPCHMYAITREGKDPPMTAIRRSVYSLLKPVRSREVIVNVLGNFAPLDESCELPGLLKEAGFDRVMEVSACRSFEEYQKMGGARLNLVLNPESRSAAEDLRQRLGTPYCELARLYQLDRIQTQYSLFQKALGITFDDRLFYEQAKKALDQFQIDFCGLRCAVGQMLNANAFELSLALVRSGMKVPVIFANYNENDYPYLRELVRISPKTRVYSSLSPSMVHFKSSSAEAAVTIGMDAGYYLPSVPNVPWNRARQPFGYQGLVSLLGDLTHALKQNIHKGEADV